MGAGKAVRNADESGHDGISELCRSLRRRQFETIVVRRPPGCPSDRIRSTGGTAPATAFRPLAAPELALNGSALPGRPVPTRLESARRKRTTGPARGANSPSMQASWRSRLLVRGVGARFGRSPGLPVLDPDGCPCGGSPRPGGSAEPVRPAVCLLHAETPHSWKDHDDPRTRARNGPATFIGGRVGGGDPAGAGRVAWGAGRCGDAGEAVDSGPARST